MLQLTDRLINQIECSSIGSISFHEFMRRSLYEPELGYYSKNKVKIGKEGDFYTSSNIGTLLGEMLAVTFVRWWDRMPGLETYWIVEWGAGTGRLADQILSELSDSYPHYYSKVRYLVIDSSDYHRGIQQEALSVHGENVKVITPEQWEQTSLPPATIVLSNELLDAYPVYRIKKLGGIVQEIQVGYDADTNRFIELLQPIDPYSPLGIAVRTEAMDERLMESQTAEMCPDAGEWISRMATKLPSGWIVTIDYGDTADRLYVPERFDGTLVCYYEHQANRNPYIHIGEQDITAHVNFSCCIREGIASGMTDWSLVTQKQFLLDAGIMDKLVSHEWTDPFHPVVRRNRAIRQLLLTDELAENFKVLIMKKDD